VHEVPGMWVVRDRRIASTRKGGGDMKLWQFYCLLLVICIMWLDLGGHLHEIGCVNDVERLCHVHWMGWR